MTQFLGIDDVELNNQRVLLRVDLNVPVQDKQILSDAKIIAIIPTLKQILAKGGKPILISHFGRPTQAAYSSKFSLKIVLPKLQELLGCQVNFQHDLLDSFEVPNNTVVLCENVRFLPGEVDNDQALATQMATLADIFVMDAFASCHRAHASVNAIAKFVALPIAGPLLQQEIAALTKVIDFAAHPLLTIIGGSKISTKLTVLQSLCKISDYLIAAGGIANTLLHASGKNIGSSICEHSMSDLATNLLNTAMQYQCKIILPEDSIVAPNLDSSIAAIAKDIKDIQASDKIFDIGPKSISIYNKVIANSKTILFNGPLGVYENKKFAVGTQSIASSIASSSAYSVVGGGDTVAALEAANISQGIDYISTAGGAFLEYIESKDLPGLINLREKNC